MVFRPISVLTSAFRRAVGRRGRKIHPMPQASCRSETVNSGDSQECRLEDSLERLATTPEVVCEYTNLLKTEESKLVELTISRKHNIPSNDKTPLSHMKSMESFWSTKSLVEREYFAHEYAPEDGGRTDTWNGLFRRLENLMMFQDPGLELYSNPQCRVYNRYRTVLPYIKNRVKLSGGSNDYINASYVTVEEVKCSYIVTQGPLRNTIHHFWEMIWEQKTTGIVMLCRCEESGREKSAQYWPKEVHGCLVAGNFMVECYECTESDSYTVSSLEILNMETQEIRTLLHFHYRAWPDFGVPQDEGDFVGFLTAVRNSGVLRPSVGPAVVHCSAGIGRSGVFVLVDVCLSLVERGETLNRLNLNDVLLELRTMRDGLVHTPEQLRFAYLAVLTAGCTTLGLRQATVEELKKEVEDEMNTADLLCQLTEVSAPAKVVYVRPFLESPFQSLALPLSPVPIV